MTIKQRNFCVREASAYTDAAAYISDLTRSSIWEDGEGTNAPAKRVEELRALWEALNAPMRDLIAPMNMTEAAEFLCIPYRTMQNWCEGVRQCPPYVRLMIAEKMEKI